jgi:hypothetical protein
MVDPLSTDPVTSLSGSSTNPLAGGPLALVPGSSNALFSEIPVSAEAAAILELVDQAATQAAVISSPMANAAAATVEISPEALAQAAASGLPAILSDDSPAFPRSAEARRSRSDDGVAPVSGLERWQDAIQLFKENSSGVPPRLPQPRANPICPFCGKAHPWLTDSLSGSVDSCPVTITPQS